LGQDGLKGMKKLLALGLVAVGASSAHAIMFDDFSTGALDLQLNPPTTFLDGNRVGSMVGGNAYHAIVEEANPDSGRSRMRVNLISGVLSVSNEDLVDTVSIVGYGADPAGVFNPSEDLNLNLSGQDRFRLTFRSNDLPMVLTTEVFDAESFYTSVNTSQIVAAGNNFTVDVLFSSLGGYNFGDLDAVAFVFDTPASGDFALTSIEAVPEPATLAVLGLGAAALMRRRKKA
jgi:hypothetical protein